MVKTDGSVIRYYVLHSDTLFTGLESCGGNKYMQVFITEGADLIHVVPMVTKNHLELKRALFQFENDAGRPSYCNTHSVK